MTKIRNWKQVKKGKYGEMWENTSSGDKMVIWYRDSFNAYHLEDERGHIEFEGEAKSKRAVILKAKKVMRNNI